MRRSIPILWAAFMALPCLAQIRPLPVPDRGYLLLKLPKAWKEVKRSTPPGLPPMIELERLEPPKANLQVTVMFARDGELEFTSDANVRRASLSSQRPLKNVVLESELPLVPISGPSGRGYLYKCTDKNFIPGRPNDYPVLTHAEFAVGTTIFRVSILSNAKGDRAVQEALEAIKKANLGTSAREGMGSRQSSENLAEKRPLRFIQ